MTRWQVTPSDGFTQARPFYGMEGDDLDTILRSLFRELPEMSHATCVDLDGEDPEPIRQKVRAEYA